MLTPAICGKERDAETGFDYFGARYYASHLGTIHNADSAAIRERHGQPQLWNKYSYVEQSVAQNRSGRYDGDGIFTTILTASLH